MAESEEAGIERGMERGIEQGKIEGIKQGKIAGKLEGEKEKALEIAKKMLAEGMNINIITKITGLSEAEIESLNN